MSQNTPGKPRQYVGQNRVLIPFVTRNRQPTLADYRQPETGNYYVFGCVWQVGIDPSTGVYGELWMLTKIVANQGYWVMISTGSGASIETVTGDDTIAVGPDGVGNVNLTGNVVANAAHAKPVFTTNNASNSERIDIQLATTVTPTPANSNSVGLSCYNENQFQINATSGMVSLKGSTSLKAVLTLTGNTGGAIPADSNGNINTTGNGATNGITVDGSGNSQLFGVYRWVQPVSNNWTAVVEGSGSAGTATYIKQHAVYGRIGGMIFFTFDLQWTNHTGTGDMLITGFPKTFTQANTNYPYIAFVENITLPANSVQVLFNGMNGDTFGNVVVNRDGTTKANVQMSAAGTICCYGYYFSDQA